MKTKSTLRPKSASSTGSRRKSKKSGVPVKVVIPKKDSSYEPVFHFDEEQNITRSQKNMNAQNDQGDNDFQPWEVPDSDNILSPTWFHALGKQADTKIEMHQGPPPAPLPSEPDTQQPSASLDKITKVPGRRKSKTLGAKGNSEGQKKKAHPEPSEVVKGKHGGASVDVELLHKMMVKVVAKKGAIEAQTRPLSCSNCGAKDLVVECTKGCHAVTPFSRVYGTMLNVVKQSSQSTRDMISYKNLAEKDEHKLHLYTKSMQVIAKSINQVCGSLQEICPPEATSSPKPGRKSSTSPRKSKSSIADMSKLGVQLVLNHFDEDGDCVLNMNEVSSLYNAFPQDFTFQTALDSWKASGCNTLDLPTLQHIYSKLEPSHLKKHLTALDLSLGNTTDLQTSFGVIAGALNRLATLNTKASAEHTSLLETIAKEKKKTEHIEAYLDLMVEQGQEKDKQILELKALDRLRIEAIEEEQLKARQTTSSSSKQQEELLEAQKALIDMRKLLNEQIVEKEYWQRQCWKLEEAKSSILLTYGRQQQHLQKLENDKKTEEKKTRMLYLTANVGRKRPPTAAEKGKSRSKSQSRSRGKSQPNQ